MNHELLNWLAGRNLHQTFVEDVSKCKANKLEQCNAMQVEQIAVNAVNQYLTDQFKLQRKQS
jgi:hypothetical protein